LLTREYPPHVYGGAGVHVAELSAVLRRHVDVRVRCFDGPRGEEGVTGYSVPGVLSGANAALGTFGVDLQMADDVAGADLVHSHTWYATLGGPSPVSCTACPTCSRRTRSSRCGPGRPSSSAAGTRCRRG